MALASAAVLKELAYQQEEAPAGQDPSPPTEH